MVTHEGGCHCGRVRTFDGANWEEHVAELAAMSE